jgi:hypothetical protein
MPTFPSWIGLNSSFRLVILLNTFIKNASCNTFCRSFYVLQAALYQISTPCATRNSLASGLFHEADPKELKGSLSTKTFSFGRG